MSGSRSIRRKRNNGADDSATGSSGGAVREQRGCGRGGTPADARPRGQGRLLCSWLDLESLRVPLTDERFRAHTAQ
jgi:hypothetical protein